MTGEYLLEHEDEIKQRIKDNYACYHLDEEGLKLAFFIYGDGYSDGRKCSILELFDKCEEFRHINLELEKENEKLKAQIKELQKCEDCKHCNDFGPCGMGCHDKDKWEKAQ